MPRRARPDFSFSWSEGRFVDLWMLVHTSSGVAGGLFSVFLPWRYWQVALAGFGLMVLWEVLEYAWGIRESAANVLLDVVVGMVGLSFGLWAASLVSTSTGRWLWVAMLAVTLTGTGLGSRAAKRRASKAAT
jgi:hypothetical protein